MLCLPVTERQMIMFIGIPHIKKKNEDPWWSLLAKVRYIQIQSTT